MTGSCDVCIDHDNDDGAEVVWMRDCVARKAVTCCECGDPLLGKRHELTTGKWEGDWFTFRTCLVCVEIRKMATCGGGWIYGQLWEDIRDQMFTVGTLAGCLSRLETAEAKQKLAGEWREWKGLAPESAGAAPERGAGSGPHPCARRRLMATHADLVRQGFDLDRLWCGLATDPRSLIGDVSTKEHPLETAGAIYGLEWGAACRLLCSDSGPAEVSEGVSPSRHASAGTPPASPESSPTQ